MTIRVLIVDDSAFICKRIQQILEEEDDFHIVGVASNGKQAHLLAAQLEPDVITMDVEMPIMDGISAVKKIMSECPTAILMFSAATHAGAQATLDALNAGAVDFLPKQLDDIDDDREMAKRLLRRRVRMVALQANKLRHPPYPIQKGLNQVIQPLPSTVHTRPASTQQKQSGIDLLVIVASTGGPVAIQKILIELPANCSFPILIVQHMPHNFTHSFAERLNQLCHVRVKEARQNDVLKPGLALLAPGGMQMQLTQHQNGTKTIATYTKQTQEIYAPCADITLSSIASFYSHVLVVVLTGMGSDGREGAKALKQKGAIVWAQDEASSTIYGMPKAIVDANLANKVYSLDKIANEFKKLN